MIQLEAQRGRVRLRMIALPMGRDLCVTLSGGDQEHIGAVALRHPGGAETQVLTLPEHREDELARTIAARLSAHQGATVCVACGIHLDDIQPSEIADVLELAEELTRQLMDRLDAS